MFFVVSFVLWAGFLVGYALGHYEALRCSCEKKRRP